MRAAQARRRSGVNSTAGGASPRLLPGPATRSPPLAPQERPSNGRRRLQGAKGF